MWVLKDEQSGKEKFRGSEKECLEFSKQNPNCNFIMVNLEEEKKKE